MTGTANAGLGAVQGGPVRIESELIRAGAHPRCPPPSPRPAHWVGKRQEGEGGVGTSPPPAGYPF